MIVTNAQGRSFFILVVMRGEHWPAGLPYADRGLEHDSDDPFIMVFDYTYAGRAFGPRGQYVSGYGASTLAAGIPGAQGINLQGDVPEWQIDAAAWAPVVETARRLAARQVRL